jgi:hypothetical protein
MRMTTLLFMFYPKSCAQEIKEMGSVTSGESGINGTVIIPSARRTKDLFRLNRD